MVESLPIDPDGEGDDFESMLAMNTEQQHARNTVRHLKLLDKENTTFFTDDKFFEDG